MCSHSVGVITAAIGIVTVYALPDFPHTWKRLSPELQRIANRRMSLEAADVDLDEEGGMSQVKGFKLAFRDSKTVCSIFRRTRSCYS